MTTKRAYQIDEDNFFNTILRYEQQGVNRAALMALIEPELKVIDSKRKEDRESLERMIKKVTATDAAKVANAVCPTVPGVDNAAKQRLSRRRNWLKSLCAKVHTDYDYTLVDGTIFCEYVGCSFTREAKNIIAAIEKVKELDLETTCNQKDLVTALKQASVKNHAAAKVIDETTVQAIDSVLARVSGVAARLNGTTNKEAEESVQKAESM